AIFFDGLVQKTALDAFLTCLAVWIISGIIVSPTRLRTWGALGATMAALSLTRENALILIVVLLVWCVIGPIVGQPKGSPLPSYFGRGRSLDRLATMVRQTAALLVGVTLLLLPVAIRNYAVGGGFYLTTSQFGPNFYLVN